MELRKQKEIEYYDKHFKKYLESAQKTLEADFEGFNPFLLGSYKFLRRLLEKKCKGRKVLDFGCGNGIHSLWLAKAGAEVVAIDLSRYSLAVAKEKALKAGVAGKIEFLVMDCEKLEFPDNYFDIVFDGGTFSSLELEKAYPELARVLKPDGVLLGIETFGHNPLANLKRKINKLTGKRTPWAAEHIFKIEDLKTASDYFEKIETYFFHPISCLIFPFLGLPGGKILLRLLEQIDKLILLFPFLRKYSFKIVFVFFEPKKQDDKKII